MHGGVAPGSPQARALRHIAAHQGGGTAQPLGPAARITLHFHPERGHQGRPVLQALLDDGCYKSQFETGTSNGGLTAHGGGDRWRWESRLFGGAYDGAAPAERPKYGALNFRALPTGAAPRFGSSYLRLQPEVLQRATFCYPDSVFGPQHFGTAAQAEQLLALSEADSLPDPLDRYIEAHVHGPVLLARDVQALVLDPCFRGSPLEELAHQLPCPIEWHAGFRLEVETLLRHPDYRGAAIAALGARIARQGVLTPATLGEAAATGRHDAQALKKVWHCLARFGDLSQAPGA
jgi:hypothetical protein